LFRHHDYSLRRKSPIAVVKEVFEGRPEKVNNENVVKALLAKVIDIRNTSCSKSVWARHR
jgi:hypothetical protein